MPRLTVKNLTNSPLDLEGGVLLPAMGGEVTADFSDHYAEALKVSPALSVVETPEPDKPIRRKKPDGE